MTLRPTAHPRAEIASSRPTLMPPYQSGLAMTGGSHFHTWVVSVAHGVSLVFCHPDGKPLRPNTITRAWPMLAARAVVKVIRFHDGRHCHASFLLKQNVHPRIVQERLGHATISVTLDTYSHVAPGLQEAAAKNFDKLGMLADEKVTEGVR